MDNDNRLPERVSNALTELGNIGAGNAATSLSVILDTRLVMSVPSVGIYDFNALENILGSPEKIAAGVLSTVNGDIDAMFLFIIELEEAGKLVKAVLRRDEDFRTDMGISVLKEVGNILMGSYLSSLETLTGMKMRCTQPELCIDMAAAILSVPCIEFGKVSDKALLINSNLKVGDNEIKGYVMMASELCSFDKLLNRLGIGGIDG